jgi:hypothetical protein
VTITVRMTRISLLLPLFSFLLANAVAQSPAPMNRINLDNGWTVQTSRKVWATGDAISTPKFQTKGWYRTLVPMTVLAVQVAAGEFPKPYYGMNLRKIPGTAAYEIGETVAELHNASDKPIEGKFKAEIAGLTLRLEHAESLWPAQMGSPNLYDLHTSFSIAKRNL